MRPMCDAWLRPSVIGMGESEARVSKVMGTAVWATIIVLIAIVLVFAGIRIAVDTPLILAGRTPDPDAFEARYVRHPLIAYLHIIPGLVYLLGAPFQLSRRFRDRHLNLHRQMGRVLLISGVLSGVFALAFGIPFPVGGAWQAAATAVFGSYFLVCLLLAYRAIRRRDVGQHRRWQVRAFAIGLGVGTIRIWVGLLAGLGVLAPWDAFAVAFWLAFLMHTIAAEVWLFWRGRRPSQLRRRL